MNKIFRNVLIIVAMFITTHFTASAETAVTDSVARQAAEALAADTLPTVRDLDELVVEKSNVIRRGNTDSYIVTQEMRKGKYTAGELLRNISGMDYEPVSEEVRYLGSTNVIILVDSIEKDASYIKRQSPDRFDRIDIVERPGGQYRGYDVLINYHPRPHYTGFETNIRVPFAIKPEANGKGKEFANINPYADATYMYEKLTVTGAALWGWARSASSTYSSTEYPMNRYLETIIEQDREHPIQRVRNNRVNGQLWADYKFNDRHKLSALWSILSDYTPNSTNYSMKVDDNGAESLVGVSLNNITKNVLTNTAGLYYNGQFGQWHLNLATNYVHASWNTLYSLDRTDGYSLFYDRRGIVNYYYGKANLSRSFNDNKWQLNFYTDISATNQKETDILTGGVLSDSRILENSTFVSATFNPTPKWSFYADAGATVYSGSEAGNRTTKVQPRWQLNATWIPSDDFRINAYYLMQAGSVESSQIRAFGQFTDRFKYQEGNPELLPSMYNMGYVRLTFRKRFAVYGQYNVTDNNTFNIYTAANTDPANPEAGYYYALGKYQNGRLATLSIGANIVQPIGRSFSIRFNGAVQRFHASYKDLNNHLWLPTGDLSLWYQLPQHNISASFRYYIFGDGSATPQQFKREISDLFMLYLSKGFFRNRLNISAQWVLPVHITRGDLKSWLVSPNMIQRSWGNEQFRDNNRVFVTISYRFSTGKQIQKTQLDVQDVTVGSKF